MLNWIEQSAEAGGLDNALSRRMQLVAEELFVNSLHHGYGCECDAEISLALAIDEHQASLTFSDHAPPFNLLQSAPLPASSERIGGIGLNLVRALASAIRYQRSNDCNITRLEFTKPVSPHHSRLSN